MSDCGYLKLCRRAREEHEMKREDGERPMRAGAQRAPNCEAVRNAALLSGWCHHSDVIFFICSQLLKLNHYTEEVLMIKRMNEASHLAHQRNESFGKNSIVIRDQNSALGGHIAWMRSDARRLLLQ
jgi:hypothetical protein